MTKISNVAITIATFKRPDLLRTLLNECSEQAEGLEQRVRLVVIDNDPAGSASVVAADFPRARYVIEPQPGIAAARNRGLQELTETDDAVIFIDDDEVPKKGWLRTLISYANHHTAGIVTGPVEPLITDAVPRWIIDGGFWQRARLNSGAVPGNIATNNTLLRLSVWRANPVIFSEELSLKGGSDTEFFRQLRSGTDTTALWCDEAIVGEHLIASRLRPQWLFRRAVRIGNINARYQSKPRALLGGIARVVVGAPYTAVDYLRTRHPVARSFNMLAHGVGMIGNAFDADVVEYRRKDN